MKTQLTKDIEKRFLYEFNKLGLFNCPEVGINLKRYGYPRRWYKHSKLTEQDMERLGYNKINYTDLEIVDLLSWQYNKNIWRCYEIKTSLSDFKSTAAKTFIGNYNYYIVPDTLYDKIKDLVPKDIGIYTYMTAESEYKYIRRLVCVKKCKKQKLQCPQEDLYYGLIKSLYREFCKHNI